MDVENCDTILSLDDLRLVCRKLSLSNSHRFILPLKGHRIMSPPQGYFTAYIAYFTYGLTILPKPLLVEVLRSVGLCLSQLTLNALMYFKGFCHLLGELGLPISLDSFHTLFGVRKVAHESYFYFYPRSGCNFLEGCISSRGSWNERFFYIRDDNWGFPSL
ncbi:hypothetical protein Pfo_010093 [Paulownia fortunei]|nr:hypothetical protein Pfo_010093 [Paulownia fortunei]